MGVINKQDIISIALLYRYQASDGREISISSDTIKEYKKAVDENLIKMESNVDMTFSFDNPESIYLYSKDENNKGYYILRSNFDIEKARSEYIGSQPLDLIVASQEETALKVIGLQLVDKHLTKEKKDNAKQLIRTLNN